MKPEVLLKFRTRVQPLRSSTLVAISFLCIHLLPAQPGNSVFISGTEGYGCFRIPAIVRNAEGTLLAFAEGRRDNCSDTGQIDLVMKVSGDNGNTWGPLQVLVSREGYTSGNPSPIVDLESGTIHLIITSNLSTDHEWQIIDGSSTDTRRIHYLYSEDLGVSWSDPREITGQVKQDNWTWYATGPGSGIQLRQGPFAGRLMVACDHIEADSRKYFSHVIYSDDQGKSWNLGGSTPFDQVNECELAELGGGVLMLNMRNYDRSVRTRKFALSTDGGSTWSQSRADPALIEPICQASLHAHEIPGESSLLFFSNPASDSARVRMTLRWSRDEGNSWHGSKLIHEGPSTYSDLVSLGADAVGVLFEAGYKNPYEGIYFQKVLLRDLMD